MLKTYQDAGIGVTAVGLETWGNYTMRPDALGVLRTPEELAASQPLPPPVSNSPLFLQLAREQRVAATSALPYGDALPWLHYRLDNIQWHTENDGLDFAPEAERYRQAIKEVEAERAH